MPESYRIRITSRAFGDISEICSYIERDSPQNAGLVARQILDAIDSLGLLPYRYRIYQHKTNPAKSVHAMPLRPFMVYYRVLESVKLVEIITVRHGSRDEPGNLT
jgi:plasmid stabilization system protein ParE